MRLRVNRTSMNNTPIDGVTQFVAKVYIWVVSLIKTRFFSVTSILNDFRDKMRKFVVRNKQGRGKLEFSLDAIKCYRS